MPDYEPKDGRTIYFNQREYRRQDTLSLNNVRKDDVVLLDEVHAPFLVRAVVGPNTSDVQYVLISEAHMVSRGQNTLMGQPELLARIQLLYSPADRPRKQVAAAYPFLDAPAEKPPAAPEIPVRERAIDLS